MVVKEFGWEKDISVDFSLNDALSFVIRLNNTKETRNKTVSSLLQIFATENFIGPLTKKKTQQIFEICSRYDNESKKELELDGEEVTFGIRFPFLLLLSNQLLKHITPETEDFDDKMWKMRSDFIHQKCLQSPVFSLKKTLTNLIQSITTQTETHKQFDSPEINLEIGLIHSFYHSYDKSLFFFEKASKLLELSVSLTGVMSKRMKYQQHDRATLHVAIKRENENENNNNSQNNREVNNSLESGNYSLESRISEVSFFDENILPEAELRSEIPGYDIKLSGLEVCVVISLGLNKLRSQLDELVQEEARAFFERTQRDSNHFLTHLTSLLFHLSIRFRNSKLMEKAIMQMEAISDQFNEVDSVDESNNSSSDSRFSFFYQLPCDPYWNIRCQYAKMVRKIGLVKTALDIYVQFEQWEEILDCFILLGRLSQVEEMILERLEIKKEPKLLTILGDIRHDEQFYHQAWEISNQRYSKAKQRLGKHAFQRNELEVAISHFEDCVRVNLLQPEIWFQIGCAATQLGNHQKAAEAYTECCLQDSTNGQAWNNLAAALLEIGKLKEAHNAFKQALKTDREHIKIWENFLVVSAKLHEESDVLVATETLFKLEKNRNIDVEALGMLVAIVESKIKNKNDENKSSEENKVQSQAVQNNWFTNRVLSLFEQITTTTAGNPTVWDLYAKIEKLLDHHEKALEFQIRSCRTIEEPGWESDQTKFNLLYPAYLKLGDYSIGITNKKSLFSVRTMLQSFVTRSTEYFGATEEFSKISSVLEQVKEIERALKQSTPQ